MQGSWQLCRECTVANCHFFTCLLLSYCDESVSCDVSVYVCSAQEQKDQSFRAVLLATLGIAALGVAFVISIACTDRPPKPKTSAE